MKKILLIFSLAFVCAALGAEILYLAQNDIVNEGQWFVVKAASDPELSGGTDSLISRDLLSGYALNLHQDYGYQDLRLKMAKAFDRVDLDLVFGPRTYLDLLYGSKGASRLGFRLSANPQFYPALLQVDQDGKFSSAQIRRDLLLQAGTIHISLSESEKEVKLEVEGRPSVFLPKGEGPLFLELRGSRGYLVVKEIRAFEHDHQIITENFRSWDLWEKFFFPLLGLSFVLGWALLPRPQVLSGCLLFCVLWLSFDFFYYSRCPVHTNKGEVYAVHPTVSYFNFEKWRRSLFDSFFSLYGMKDRVSALRHHAVEYEVKPALGSYCDKSNCFWSKSALQFAKKEKNEVRLLFMGGSFFKGIGIKDVKNTVLHAVWKEFSEKISPSKYVSALNISVAGAQTGEQVDLFFKNFIDYNPDFIFLGSFPYRDHDLARIVKLWRYCQSRHIKMVLLKAPKNIEYIDEGDEKKRLFEATQEYHIPTVVLSDLSLAPAFTQSGLIWWDEAHMTDYGGRSMGAFAAPRAWSLSHGEPSP